MTTTTDPALLGFLSAVVGALSLILVELIRNRRKTEDVKQEVISTKDSNDTQLVTLLNEVNGIRERVDAHIKWHLEGTHYVYVRPAGRHRDL